MCFVVSFCGLISLCRSAAVLFVILDTVCWGASSPLSSLDMFGGADLVRKTSVIFEALQRFGEHAQCASE